MNIVKIKDVVLTPDNSSWTEEQCELFNTYFKGKYVHAIDWRYCVPLEEASNSEVMTMSYLLCNKIRNSSTAPGSPSSTPGQVVEIDDNPWVCFEHNEDDCDDLFPIDTPTTDGGAQDPAYSTIDILGGCHYLPYTNLYTYIDQVETDRINSTDKYVSYNEFTITGLTEEQVKKFRTWLASTILTFDIPYEDATMRMLKYYAGGMYDDTVAALVLFGGQTSTLGLIGQPSVSSCGCANGATLANLNMALSVCDPLEVYRRKVYEKMVEIFSAIDFWMEFDPEFLQMFKLYIDSIIKMNLPLVVSQYQSEFVDCSCKIGSNTGQELNMQRLARLSTALGYMIEGSVSGHRTYITNAFNDWATYLYERMEW